MNRSIRVLIAVAGLALAACGSTGGSPAGGAPAGGTTSAPTTPAIVAVGAVMLAQDGKAMTVTSFKRNYSTGNEFEVPATGNEFVRVTMTLVNGSSGEWSYPLGETSVVDANGQKYSASFIASDNISGLVATGHAIANVTYEVPTGTALNFTWTPNLFTSEVYQTALK